MSNVVPFKDELLFGGFHNNIWYEGGYFKRNNIHYIITCMNNDGSFTFINVKNVYRYTGVVDKRGNKIFEGHLIKTYTGNISEIVYGEFTDRLSRQKSIGFHFHNINTSEYDSFSHCHEENRYEIIDHIDIPIE